MDNAINLSRVLRRKVIKTVYRLKEKKQFNFVYKRGYAINNHALVLISLKVKDTTVKVGFSISAKYGKATVRNKTKRQLRHIVGKVTEEIVKGTLVVLVIREGARNLTFEQLEKQTLALFVRAKLIKPL